MLIIEKIGDSLFDELMKCYPKNENIKLCTNHYEYYKFTVKHYSMKTNDNTLNGSYS